MEACGGVWNPPQVIIMGSKYKKKFEREWECKPISAMRIKMLQEQADKNLSKVTSGSYRRIRRLK